MFYGFLLFYKLAPRRRTGVTFEEVWLPALVVTALLQLCQWLLTLYTTHVTNFNAVYGAFGGVVAMLLWIYSSGLVIVFGGCLCAARRGQLPTSTATPGNTKAAGGIVPCT
jgi:Ca2+-transporting ATPase